MERNLNGIQRGELPADDFRRKIEAYTLEITSELLSCDKLFARHGLRLACPKCGRAGLQFYGKVVRLRQRGVRAARVPPEKRDRTLSDDEIKDLLTEGHTKLLKGFKSKQGKSFDAVVAFDGTIARLSVFPEAKKGKKFSGRKK